MTANNDQPIVLSVAQKDDLISETTLWDIWRGSLRIQFSRFNKIAIFIALAFLCIDAIFSDAAPMLDLVRASAKDGVVLGLSVLSLLLSGFAVFATISQPTMLLSMAAESHESGLSFLKYNFFVFMRVFCLLIAFTALCLVLMIAGRYNGIGSHLVRFFGNENLFRDLVVKSSYVFLFLGYVIVLLQIKSFVFNIYYSVMTSLRWRADGKK